jgi:hypothetical protein
VYQREALEEEHREDAGHQVEQQAAEQGEPDGAEGGDLVGGGAGVEALVEASGGGGSVPDVTVG